MEAITILRRFVNLPSPTRLDRSIATLQAVDLLESSGLTAAMSDDDPNLLLRF